MKLGDSFLVPATLESAWQVFFDPVALGYAMPGCESVAQIDETHYEAVLAVKIPFMTLRTRAHGTLIEVQPPHHLLVELVGEPLAMAGAFHALLAIDLAARETQTAVSYTLDLTMLGRLASLGEAMVRTTARQQTAQFAANLAALFEQPGDGATRP